MNGEEYTLLQCFDLAMIGWICSLTAGTLFAVGAYFMGRLQGTHKERHFRLTKELETINYLHRQNENNMQDGLRAIDNMSDKFLKIIKGLNTKGEV